jgi:acyl-CoA synthetase (AMP-forming)/AMP-acid ligase II
MADLETLPVAAPASRLNVTDRLARFARAMPDSTAIVCPCRGVSGNQQRQRGASGALYDTITFAELDADVTQIANGLAVWGVPMGARLALLVKPSIEFVTLVFALLRAGMVIVLVDPGLGRRNLIRSLAEAEPEGFVAISIAQAARLLLRHKFPRAHWNVTVGRRWMWGGKTLDQLRVDVINPKSEIRNPKSFTTHANDPAAIVFTSGSTGPPKGVLYTQRMFNTQVQEIQSAYGIEPGGIDLACFPLFALFNSAMGVTTVLPEMDFSRPALADPKKLLMAANDWQVSQAFASPAVWRVLGEHCARTGERIASLRKVFSCGAPVPTNVLRNTLACVGDGAKMHTPYGATECLPVSTIEAAEILNETAARTDQGAGVCVGRKFESINWRVIRISDEPVTTMDDAEELAAGEIGELIVRGPQVSREYVTRKQSNAQSKIIDPNDFWHRTGDIGYFDELGRFWYCGRKSQRVETRGGALFTECVEGVCNTHPAVRRSALVGVGQRGEQSPVLVVERATGAGAESWYQELLKLLNSNPTTREIRHVLPHPSLPVDIRHNAKINRELLASWAETQLRS